MDSVGKWLVLKHWCLKSFSASQDVSLGRVQVTIISTWFV